MLGATSSDHALLMRRAPYRNGSVIEPTSPAEPELAGNSLMNFTPSRTFTRLERGLPRKRELHGERADAECLNEMTGHGVEKAASIEMASGMIGQLAAQLLSLRSLFHPHRHEQLS